MARVIGYVGWSLLLLVGVFLTGSVGRAADPEVRLDDLYRTQHARALLFEDEILGPLNLGVRVRNRVAVLWGPVPSFELRLRAEIRLRTMIELMEVRNELYLQQSDPTLPSQPLRPGTPLFLPDPQAPPAPMVPQQKTPLNPFGSPVELLGAIPESNISL